MGFIDFMMNFLDGQPGTRCAHPGCSREQFQFGGFCHQHTQQKISTGRVMDVEYNRLRAIRQQPAVESIQAHRAQMERERIAREAAKEAEREAKRKLREAAQRRAQRAPGEDVDPREAFRKMEESLGLRAGSLYSIAQDEDFGDE